MDTLRQEGGVRDRHKGLALGLHPLPDKVSKVDTWDTGNDFWGGSVSSLRSHILCEDIKAARWGPT